MYNEKLFTQVPNLFDFYPEGSRELQILADSFRIEML